MNKKIAALSIAAASLAGVYLALGDFAFSEIFFKNAIVSRKVLEKQKKRVPLSFRNASVELENAIKKSTETVQITDRAGHKLTGLFLPPSGELKAIVICSHGYRSSALHEFALFAEFYSSRGIGMIFAFHPASGESFGKLITFGKRESESLLCWLEAAKSRFGSDIPVIIHGMSMGASSALLLCDNPSITPNVRFIVSDSAFTSLKPQLLRSMKTYHLPAFTMPIIRLNALMFMRLNMSDVVPLEHVARARIPILFVHGRRDTVAPANMAEELRELCASESELFIAENAGHIAARRKAFDDYSRHLNNFISKYIPS